MFPELGPVPGNVAIAVCGHVCGSPESSDPSWRRARRFGGTQVAVARVPSVLAAERGEKARPGCRVVLALAVEPQEVVLGETESADRRLRFYTTVRPMPVVLVQPDRKFVGATVGCGIGLGVSPFPERGLDEALGLAVGFR